MFTYVNEYKQTAPNLILPHVSNLIRKKNQVYLNAKFLLWAVQAHECIP